MSARTIALTAALAIVTAVTLTGCDDAYDQAQRQEQQRYTTCVENGGTYTHTEDAWGENWSCKK